MPFKDAQGRPVEAVYVGELAARLDKSSHTVRRWQRQQVLPATSLSKVALSTSTALMLTSCVMPPSAPISSRLTGTSRTTPRTLEKTTTR